MSKSRAGKEKAPQEKPPQPPVTNDVVPGRFSENDWSHLLDEETEEDFITDILQEVVSNALDSIYHKIVQARVIPYTVNAARELLLETIEWQFLVKDPGETGVIEDATWLEDEEPVPAVTDSWAQGIVPVVMKIQHLDTTIEEEEDKNENETEIDGQQHDIDQRSQTASTSIQINDDSNTVTSQPKEEENAPTATKHIPEMQPKPPSKPKKQTKPTFKPHRGKVPAFTPITATPTGDEKQKNAGTDTTQLNGAALISTDSIFKARNEKLASKKDVIYDFKGNVIHVQKLNMDRLPSHRVKTKFAVVDPLEEEFKAKLANKRQRYNFLRNGGKDTQKEGADLIADSVTTKDKEMKLVSPLPPPLVDNIDVSPGVVIKEKGVIKRGLRQPLNQYYSKDAAQLKPLGSISTSPQLKAREIPNDPKTVVRTLNSNRPLPAISTRD